MKWHTALASLVILILCVVSPVHASCAEPVSPEQNLQESDVVFSGEVIRIEPTEMAFKDDSMPFPISGDKVTFTVLESWTGVDAPTVTLEVPSHSENYTFEQGQQYLIYAYYGTLEFQSAPLTTNGCKGNKLLAEAHDDLQGLGPGSVPSQPAADEHGEAGVSSGASSQELASGTGIGSVSLMLAVGSLLVITLSIGFFLRQRHARR